MTGRDPDRAGHVPVGMACRPEGKCCEWAESSHAPSPGLIEYWCGTSYGNPGEGRLGWSSKLDTDLFDLAKAKATAKSLEASRV